jgi:hypothetical protein
MIIKCNAKQCPWNYNEECSKGLIQLYNGQCLILINQVLSGEMIDPVDDRCKNKVTIVDGDFEELEDD